MARTRSRSVASAPAGAAHATHRRVPPPRACRKESTAIQGPGASPVLAQPQPAEAPTPPSPRTRKPPSVPAKRKSPPANATASSRERSGHISTSPSPPTAKRNRVPSPAPRAAQGTTVTRKQGGLPAAPGAPTGPGRPVIPNPRAFPERQRAPSLSPREAQGTTGAKKTAGLPPAPRATPVPGRPPLPTPRTSSEYADPETDSDSTDSGSDFQPGGSDTPSPRAARRPHLPHGDAQIFFPLPLPSCFFPFICACIASEVWSAVGSALTCLLRPVDAPGPTGFSGAAAASPATAASDGASPRSRIFQALPGDTLTVFVDRLNVAGFASWDQLSVFLNAHDRS